MHVGVWTLEVRFEVGVVGHICKWEDWFRATELDGEREKTRTRKVYITRIVV